MPQIRSQVLEVSYPPPSPTLRRIGLRYRTKPIRELSQAENHCDQPPLVDCFVPIPHWQGVCSDIQSLQEMAWDLALHASGKDRFDEKARRLAKDILPPQGFGGMFQVGLHPQLDIMDDYSATVPWEFLQECHWICPTCQEMSNILPPPPARNCPGCNQEMSVLAPQDSVAQYVCRQCANQYALTDAPHCGTCRTAMQQDGSVYETGAPLMRYRCPRCEKQECNVLKVRYCQHDPTQMEFRIVRLATEYHMTHLPGMLRRDPPGEGNRFLIVGDPKGDLTDRRNDPNGVCYDHLEWVRRTLEASGFEVDWYPPRSATREHILEAIGDPCLRGAYFFCHGGYEKGSRQSFLMLNDGKVLAAEIQRVSPRIPFVFLNACHGGHTEVDPGAEEMYGSVAQAFIQAGPGRTLIAPICRVTNTSAAAMARRLFMDALAGTPLGQSLMAARRKALTQYEGQAEPDVSWAMYRYFGDPNRAIPLVQAAPVGIAVGQARELPCRVFDSKGGLDPHVFAFDIAGVLLRTAKRRNQQHRKFATVADLVAGLVRVGELTRYVLTQQGVDPDTLYRRFSQVVEEGEKKSPELLKKYEMLSKESTDVQSDKELWRELIEDWVLDNEADFTSAAAAVLSRADCLAQEVDSGDHRISEETLLQASLGGGEWPLDPAYGLPDVETIQQGLSRRHTSQDVDKNGAILLDDLTPRAKRDIENAHSVALRGGVCPIPNRALLAGMTSDEDSYGAKIFECIGISHKFICSLMKACVEGNEKKADSFGLSPHACSRIITPTLKKAREAVASRRQRTVTESDLFQNFWLTANIGFKQELEKFLKINLDRLIYINVQDPSTLVRKISTRNPDFKESLFDRNVWKILTIAANIAFVQNSPSVRMPHLFVGMISCGKVAREFLQQNKLDRDLLTIVVLSTIKIQPSQGKIDDSLGLSENVRKVLSWAVEIAQAKHRARPTELDLFKAFFTEGGSIVGDIFGLLGIKGPVRLPRQDKSEKDYINVLGEKLSAHVIGQPLAIHALQAALCEDLGVRDRPWRVFGFVGPTNVGRGVVSHIMGQWLSGGDEGRLYVDLSAEKSNVSQFQNSTSNRLSTESELRRRIAEWLRCKPWSVLEFRGVGEVQDTSRALLIELLSAGEVKDVDGRSVIAKRAIVILHLNVPYQQLEDTIANMSETTDSLQLIQDTLRHAIANTVPAQIARCCDALIPFKTLDSADLKALAERVAMRLNRILNVTDQVSLKVQPDIWLWLANNSLNDEYPTRSIITKVQECIQRPLLEYLNTTMVAKHATVIAYLADGKILFRVFHSDSD